jgi:hypothetical protein
MVGKISTAAPDRRARSLVQELKNGLLPGSFCAADWRHRSPGKRVRMESTEMAGNREQSLGTGHSRRHTMALRCRIL